MVVKVAKPAPTGKNLDQRLSERLESLRKAGHLDPHPTFETPTPYPPLPEHSTGVPYVPTASYVWSLKRMFLALQHEPPPVEPEECCLRTGSICDQVRQIAKHGTEEQFRAFFGLAEPVFMPLDLTAAGKRARAKRCETIDLADEFIGDWDPNKRQVQIDYSPLESS